MPSPDCRHARRGRVRQRPRQSPLGPHRQRGAAEMAWKFEDAIPVIGTITEGPAWDGRYLCFSNIALDRVLRFEPKTERVTVWRTGTAGANGLNFDASGRLFACEGRG